jgi:hypothetical protein
MSHYSEFEQHNGEVLAEASLDDVAHFFEYNADLTAEAYLG